MKPAIKTGTILGTGGAINVELGWIPTKVEVWSADGSLVTSAFLSPQTIAFTGAGTAIPLAGHQIRGVTSRATATLQSVSLPSAGTYAAGTAAGTFVLEEGSVVGTFQAENIVITNLASGVVGTDDATIAVPAVLSASNNSAAVAAAAGNAGISRYEGTAGGASKGFTIGSTVSVLGTALRFAAFRDNT